METKAIVMLVKGFRAIPFNKENSQVLSFDNIGFLSLGHDMGNYLCKFVKDQEWGGV